MPQTAPTHASAPQSFHLPSHKTRALSNGIRLIVVEDRTQPLVSLSLAFKRGAASESRPALWGAANMMTSLLTKGTARGTGTNAQHRSAQEIADAIDFTGGSLTASGGFDSTSVSLSILSEFLPTGLELLAEVVRHPAFAEDELERLRQQTLVEVQQHLSDASYLAAVAFTQGMLRGTSYGHPTIGTLESVQALSRADCVALYEMILRPEHAFVAVAGDVDADDLRDRLESLLGDWTAPPANEAHAGAHAEAHAEAKTMTTSAAANSVEIYVIEKPDAAQTALRVGFPTVNRGDEDFIAMQFVNTILGGSFISRLNHNLREEKGYTYGIHSSVDAYVSASFWVCRTHVGSDVVGDATREILGEIERMRSAAVSDDELETTRKYILGSFVLRTETPTQVVSLLSALEMYALPADYYEHYFREIAAMTKERLFAVQQRRLSREHGLVIAASGSVQHLRSVLGTFASADQSSTGATSAGAVREVNTRCEIVP
jgi:zinc protease